MHLDAAYGRCEDGSWPGFGGRFRAFSAQASTHLRTLTAIKAGLRPPPLDRIADWAQHLNLTGTDRETFIESAQLAHCPDEIVALVRSLRQDLKALQQKRDA